jgi:acyl-homoserine-lactone acylase
MESAARAFGWAQMQSNGNLLLRQVALARGRGAEYFGKLLPPDKLQRTMGFIRWLKNGAASKTRSSRAI